MLERLYDLSLYLVSPFSFYILLNIHRCSINNCFTILKSWWKFIKTETFYRRLSFVINSSLLDYFVFQFFSLYMIVIIIIVRKYYGRL